MNECVRCNSPYTVRRCIYYIRSSYVFRTLPYIVHKMGSNLSNSSQEHSQFPFSSSCVSFVYTRSRVPFFIFFFYFHHNSHLTAIFLLLVFFAFFNFFFFVHIVVCIYSYMFHVIIKCIFGCIMYMRCQTGRTG